MSNIGIFFNPEKLRKPRSFAVIFCCVLFFLSACGSDKTTSPVYTDSLILGTGISGWSILGEGAAFINDPAENGLTIYYRVESKEDMTGTNLEFDVYRNTPDGFDLVHMIPINTFYSPHVVVGSFIHTWGEGNFKTSAVLGTNKVIGVKEFTVTNKK
jgi:hypothetical protein